MRPALQRLVVRPWGDGLLVAAAAPAARRQPTFEEKVQQRAAPPSSGRAPLRSLDLLTLLPAYDVLALQVTAASSSAAAAEPSSRQRAEQHLRAQCQQQQQVFLFGDSQLPLLAEFLGHQQADDGGREASAMPLPLPDAGPLLRGPRSSLSACSSALQPPGGFVGGAGLDLAMLQPEQHVSAAAAKRGPARQGHPAARLVCKAGTNPAWLLGGSGGLPGPDDGRGGAGPTKRARA